MHPIKNLLISITVMGLLFGCSIFGKTKEYHPFDAEKIEQLTPGKTTAADVTRYFGAPAEVVKLSNGNAYIYKRAVTKGTAFWLILVSLGNFDTKYDQLVLFFNNDDTLTHYGVSLNADKAAYESPF
ncbi:MAG: outer membrane protein assembly factor BamE [Deltaproteobacteria bacterium]|nr:outer membrane protein assembly factor BamE [Deltaproteobacteria bacterium]